MVITDFADRVARHFHPEQIILFGSYAYGAPNADSDVDMLVVLPHDGRDPAKSIQIQLEIAAAFPLDLLVIKPDDLRWRIANGDFFLREIVTRGKVLYDATDL